MMLKTLFASAVMTLAMTGMAQAAGDAAAGAGKAAVCSACHGKDGIALVPIYPNLRGQNAAYLEGALKAYGNEPERRRYSGSGRLLQFTRVTGTTHRPANLYTPPQTRWCFLSCYPPVAFMNRTIWTSPSDEKSWCAGLL